MENLRLGVCRQNGMVEIYSCVTKTTLMLPECDAVLLANELISPIPPSRESEIVYLDPTS